MRAPAFWNKPGLLGTLAAPLAIPYRLGAWIDRTLTTPQASPLPVISVGNAVIGGAGKTPTARLLLQLLQQLGETPHAISRGYGGTQTTPLRVDAGSHDWRRVGDEPLLLAQHAPVWVGRDRLAATMLAAEHGASVIIADDALQHHRLKKDISLLVVDGAFGIGNGHILPAGPLRETLASALSRSDGIILIGEDRTNLLPQLSAQHPVFHARIEPSLDTSFLRDHRWLAFAGLGRPEKFFDTLREFGAEVAGTVAFPDHFHYHRRELDGLLKSAAEMNARLITTEKDAVKLPPDMLAQVAVLPVVMQLAEPTAFTDWLHGRLSHLRTHLQPSY